VICAPGPSDLSRLADELADAKTVLVRFRPVGNLPMPMADGRFDGPWALDLDHTQEALARYRAAGPEMAAQPSSLTRELRDAVDQLLRGLGIAGTEPKQPAPK
jgi:hypothetical protein